MTVDYEDDLRRLRIALEDCRRHLEEEPDSLFYRVWESDILKAIDGTVALMGKDG
jgi:hypothetical protein